MAIKHKVPFRSGTRKASETGCDVFACPEERIAARVMLYDQYENQTMVGAGEEIRRAVLTWKDVTVHPHRFGGIEFRFGRRELGHLHGDSLLDVPFPLSVKEELIAAGKAQEHHILPESGWISFRIRTSEDIEHALGLLHRSLEIALNSTSRKMAINRITTAREQQE